jgi:hypothetical protein
MHAKEAADSKWNGERATAFRGGEQFDDKTLVDLTIGGMNAWNRVIVGFGLQPTARK